MIERVVVLYYFNDWLLIFTNAFIIFFLLESYHYLYIVSYVTNGILWFEGNGLFLESSDVAISIDTICPPTFQQVLSIMCESQAYGQRGSLCSVGSYWILEETGMKMDKHSITKVGIRHKCIPGSINMYILEGVCLVLSWVYIHI